LAWKVFFSRLSLKLVGPPGLAALPAGEAHPQLVGYQPYHPVRVELLSRSGAVYEAIDAYEMAIGLSVDDSARKYLHGRRAALITAN
jgi:RNA polymerase sigma-70 factor, ECF subfamily